MTFTLRAEGVYSDASGRFDVIRSEWTGQWHAIDWESGTGRRFPERFRAEAWCESQANRERQS